MGQYQTRKKALNRKRDDMMDLFVDSKIKLANKPIVYGEFYDYVTDLDRPAPKAVRRSAQASKPVVPTQATNATQATLEQQAKPVQPEDKNPTKPAQTSNNEESSSFWDSYTK